VTALPARGAQAVEIIVRGDLATLVEGLLVGVFTVVTGSTTVGLSWFLKSHSGSSGFIEQDLSGQGEDPAKGIEEAFRKELWTRRDRYSLLS